MPQSTRKRSSLHFHEEAYHPLALRYTRKDGTPAECNVFCGLTTKDFVLILGCYIAFYSLLFGFSALLLMGVIETNEKHSMLWSFLIVGVIFSVGLIMAVIMNTRSEEKKDEKKSGNDDDIAKKAIDEENQTEI